jgi:predicted RNA methylase
MSMTSVDSESLFSDGHPHYTPRWLSERLALHLPGRFSGAVVDPACGAGNLLAAAAVRLNGASRNSDDIEFVGSDVSKKAVRACQETLSGLLPNRNFRVEQADFLKKDKTNDPESCPTAIVMNPPFRGYGLLSETARKRVARLLDMRGRFNLSYAFVRRAVAIYKPAVLISLLPSNWVYSKASAFRTELDELNGKWEWEDIGDDAFRGISAHVGILLWEPKQTGRKARKKRVEGSARLAAAGLEVRQGVATGRDDVFSQIALVPMPFGSHRFAVRGRDVERNTGEIMWVPPSASTDSLCEAFVEHVDKPLVAQLKSRVCVKRGGRRVFEFHETAPKWFRQTPKLLLPEIVTTAVRIELDSQGRKLPLHSVIAVKVPSIAAGRRLRQYLKSEKLQRSLISRAPRLSGGAVRMQVPAIRRVLLMWLRKQGMRKTRSKRR